MNYISVNIANNKATVAIQLQKKKIRESKNQMDVFAFEKIVNDKLSVYETMGYKVAVEALK